MYEVYFNQLGYKVADPRHHRYIVEDFQRHAGTDVDGRIGPKTKAKIAFYDKDNFCPEVFQPIKPYVPYTDEQIESLLGRGLVGLGGVFNQESKENDFDVMNNLGHAVLESGHGESAIAVAKNNIYGWRAYDHDPMNSANSFENKAECIIKWSKWYNEEYLLPTGKYYRGDNEYGVNVVYASSGIAGINKGFIAQDFQRKLQDPSILTEREYEMVGKNFPMAMNFVLGEFYSTRVDNDVETTRAVKPPYIYFERLCELAQEGQKVRNGLNQKYGDNLSIGIRNSRGEIIVIIGSGWRTNVFQYYLWINGKSTTNDSRHEYALAIDINRIPGLTVRELLNFIKAECDTKFVQFIEYDWGLHLGLPL